MNYCGGYNPNTGKTVGQYHRWNFGRRWGSHCIWCGMEFTCAQERGYIEDGKTVITKKSGEPQR